jgi:hypothetical protein
MTQVSKQMKNEWGSQFKDRQNSYDDGKEYNRFVELCRANVNLRKYIEQYIPESVPKSSLWLRSKPDGDYGIDSALINKETNEKIINIDFERWSEWKNDWPSYYRCLHFLGRKDHFLNEDIPFLMVYFNNNMDKLIIVDKDTVKKYTTFSKYFIHKKCSDNVKEMKLSDGWIYGDNITDREYEIFQS